MTRRTEREREQLALKVIARRVLSHAVQGVSRDGGDWAPSWEDYPDLTEQQWLEVVDCVRDMARAQDPSEDDFLSSYEYLTGEKP